MTDPLRKAAEELIKEWDWECGEHQNKALTELIETLRQALAHPEEWKHCRHCGFQYRPPKEDKWHPLAQPEEKMRIEGSGKLTTKPYPDGYESERDFRKALAQPEQEPVGYVTIENISSWAQVPSIKWFKKPTEGPLYTAPPKREWVGLMDEEVDECYYWKDRLWTTDELVRHVEAKLKEKNT